MMQIRLGLCLSILTLACGASLVASRPAAASSSAPSSSPTLSAPARPEVSGSRTRSYAESLNQIFAMREKVRDIHPALANLYPVAIAEDGELLIFSPDESRGVFVLTSTVKQPFPIPKGIRAAFPLEALGGKPACVITPEVFDEPDGLVFVFHEFVHCTQWVTCETRLKELLGVYRDAVARKDGMWEIQHPFPYADPAFEAEYGRMLLALEGQDEAAVRTARAELRKFLKTSDLEYMIWQEWKEGIARFLENRVRARLGKSQNRGGAKPPFNRVVFYAGGDRLISWIAGSDPSSADLEKMFHAIAAR